MQNFNLEKIRISGLYNFTEPEAVVFLYFQKNETIMSPKHEKSNNELIKKYSKLLTDLATDD